MTAPQLTPQEAAFVDCQFLTLAATQSTSVFFSVMGASVVMVAIAAQKTAILPLLLWLGLVAASQLFRTRIEIAPERRKAETAPGQHLHQNVRIAVLCGTVQALCLLSFPELGVSERTLLTLIYLGLATGAVAQSAGRHSTYIAYCAPFWIPLALLWMFSPSADYSAWTGLTVGLLIIGASTTMLVGYAKHAWHLFQESCAIRFRERELNERLQRALSEAEQASRAKTRFLAAASHDLRQPLHALSLLSATLGLRPLDARSQEVVGMMNRVLASLSGQLDGLLDISKLDAGVMEVHLQNMPVSLLLTQHFNELAPLARQKGLEAELDCQLRHEQICTDPGLVLRILRNLTQNALKFTTQGKISLRARAQAGDVLIEVADTGCGIDELHHELVFEEFFQLSNQARDPGHGLGLGLSIVRRLTDLLGIDLTMQSTVHLGTTFTLRLPLAATTEDRCPVPSEAVDDSRFSLTVLVIDDEASVQSAMRLLLEEMGCTCLVAADLAEALRLSEAQAPDFVISDFRLKSSGNGIDAIAQLRQRFPGLPAVLVSGDTAPARLTLAHQARLRVCHKPLSMQTLRELLSQVSHRQA